MPAARAFVRLWVAVASADFPGTTPAPVIATAGADGGFSLNSIAPGDYTLLVRAAAPEGSGVAASGFWWARVPIAITGADVDLPTLALQPGMSFSGRVVIDGATTPAPDLTTLRVFLESESLAPMPAGGRGGVTPGMRFLQPAAVQSDGRFEVRDLVPEDYRITVRGGAIDGPTWWLRSARLADRDLLDAPGRLAPGEDVSGVTLVLSDRRTELSGTITTPAGAAVSDLVVLAYPADAALRRPHSRRVQAARPDSGGRFLLRNLPPGDYLLCALGDVDDGQWHEAGFFDPLVAASVRITIGEGASVVQDLRVGGGPSE